MNLPLFEAVKAAVREEPKRLNMAHFALNLGGVDLQSDRDGLAPSGVPSCNTVGCIAGWATIISRIKAGNKDFTEENIDGLPILLTADTEGIIALGIDRAQSDHLFYPSMWPYELRLEFRARKEGSPEYAEVVCKAIDAFVADPDEFCK